MVLVVLMGILFGSGRPGNLASIIKSSRFLAGPLPQGFPRSHKLVCGGADSAYLWIGAHEGEAPGGPDGDVGGTRLAGCKKAKS